MQDRPSRVLGTQQRNPPPEGGNTGHGLPRSRRGSWTEPAGPPYKRRYGEGAVSEDAWPRQRFCRARRPRRRDCRRGRGRARIGRPAYRYRLRPADRARTAAPSGGAAVDAHPQPRRQRGRGLRQRHALRRLAVRPRDRRSAGADRDRGRAARSRDRGRRPDRGRYGAGAHPLARHPARTRGRHRSRRLGVRAAVRAGVHQYREPARDLLCR